MALTDINTEDRLVQRTFADHLEHELGWGSVYAWNTETFGPQGTLGRAGERDVVLVRDLRAGFDDNLTDYLDTIPHAFHHNAFLVVSNGDEARYGSVTSQWPHFVQWKRHQEKDKARVDAEALLDGLLAKERLLDMVENFILFDDSRPGGARKIVARNHQVLGVNNAVAAVEHQEHLKRQFPPEERLVSYEVPLPELAAAADAPPGGVAGGWETAQSARRTLPLVKRAHPDLGRLGVFWHTQGSGKSYSMVFFAA